MAREVVGAGLTVQLAQNALPERRGMPCVLEADPQIDAGAFGPSTISATPDLAIS